MAGAAVGVGFGGLYLVGLLAAGEDIPDGVRVSGVDIGGMSRSEAGKALDSGLRKDWAKPVEVRVGDDKAALDATKAGFALDAEATLDEAAQSGSDPFTVIGRLFSSGERTVEPVVTLDETKARAALDGLAEKHDRKPREGAVRFKDGEAVRVKPVTGQKLDVDGSLGALDPVVPGRTTDPVDLPVKTDEPEVGTAEVDRALKEFARPAMSGPVTLTVGDSTVEIAAATLGEHLSMKPTKASGDTPEDGGKARLDPTFDGKGLLADPEVASPLALATDKAVNAKLRLEGGKVVAASAGRPGQEVTAKALTDAVRPLLTKSGAQRTATVAVKEVQPKISGANLDQLGIKEQMSTFTVDFEPEPYRVTNIGRAAELIDGSVVLPDETWSMNGTVGERTEANGFVEGIIINNDRYERAAGGGVSAVATTVFNAAFFAGVKPVEYGAHSFYIERYPEGREATVAWGSLDLKFRNDSGNAIYIDARATDTSITISFYGTKKYDEVESVKGPRTNVQEPGTREGAAEKCVPQTPLEGFDVAVDRVFKNNGAEVKRETFNTRYVPRDEVTCD
ncbi:VanW family protein [Streptomyces sp. NPDC091377]|uniref:VanW family protein n=1 Tax=Streptomyces sp. NPDC091377 TaxID=3365995 RepID=UPI00381DE5FB